VASPKWVKNAGIVVAPLLFRLVLRVRQLVDIHDRPGALVQGADVDAITYMLQLVGPRVLFAGTSAARGRGSACSIPAGERRPFAVFGQDPVLAQVALKILGGLSV